MKAQVYLTGSTAKSHIIMLTGNIFISKIMFIYNRLFHQIRAELDKHDIESYFRLKIMKDKISFLLILSRIVGANLALVMSRVFMYHPN